MRFRLPVCAAAFIALSALAAPAASTYEIGRDGLRSCLSSFGKSRAINAALTDTGWRDYGRLPNVRFFSHSNLKILAAYGKNGRKRICAILIRDMTEEKATEMAEGFLKLGKNTEEIQPTDAENIAEWITDFGGKRFRIYVTRQIKISVVYGSSVNIEEY